MSNQMHRERWKSGWHFTTAINSHKTAGSLNELLDSNPVRIDPADTIPSGICTILTPSLRGVRPERTSGREESQDGPPKLSICPRRRSPSPTIAQWAQLQKRKKCKIKSTGKKSIFSELYLL